MKFLIVFLMTVFFCINTANAELYKWMDENGVTHYSNVAPSFDQGVEKKTEVKSSNSNRDNSSDLESVTNSYKLDRAIDNIKNIGKRRSQPSNTNEDLADYWEYIIKEEELRYQTCLENLQEFKRKPFKDSRRNKRELRGYENRLESVRLDLERAKNEYKKAKYGR